MESEKEVSMITFEPVPRAVRSLRQQVAHTLRELIITGQLQPGDRLREEEISQQMKISRGPVREALRQLEQEGLVVSFPHRGTEVVGVSEEEVREILIPIRLTLERFAWQHALGKLTEADFAELSQLVEEMQTLGEAGDLAGVVDADVRFHERILDRSQQPHCRQIWHTISPRVRAYFFRCGPKHESLMEVAQEHQELLDALREHDIDTVFDVLDKHICDSVLKLMERTNGELAASKIDAAEYS